MKIPKKIIKKTKTHDRQIKYYEYKFIKKCNNNLLLYERTDNNAKECFTLYDLKMLNNDYIDKKINNQKKYYVLNTEGSKIKEYDSLSEIAKELNVTLSAVSNCYCRRTLLLNQYIVTV